MVRIRDPVRARTRTAGSVENSRSAREIATERDIKDEGLVGEELAHRARVGGEKRVGRAPAVRVGALVRDVVRHVRARKVPDADALLVPERRVHAPTGAVEAEAVARRIRILDAAPGVGVHARVADGGDDLAGEDGEAGVFGRAGLRARVEVAAGEGVQGGLVFGCVLGALDDVDLASCRPIIAVGPKCGPDAATVPVKGMFVRDSGVVDR